MKILPCAAKDTMPATDPVRSIDAACSSRGLVTVIGMVVSKLDAYRTSGSSYCITFELKDYDFDGPDWANSLKIKYFNDNESKLPPVLKHDVVLLRNIRVRR